MALLIPMSVWSITACKEDRHTTAPSGPDVSVTAAPTGTQLAVPGAAPVPTSLAHCLQAPYSPSHSEAPTVGQFTHRVCNRSRPGAGPGWTEGAGHHVLLGAGAAPAPAGEGVLQILIDKLRVELADAPAYSVGHGPCCSSDSPADTAAQGHRAQLPAVSCVSVSLPLCARTLTDLAQAFASTLDELHLTDNAVGLEVTYSGNTGPRCVGSAANCLPEAYLERSTQRIEDGSFALAYDPALPRRIFEHSGARNLGGACTHDGDCGRAGGSGCGAWYLPHAPGGSHVEHLQMYDDFCGCVNDRCTWFTPERRTLGLRSELAIQGWGEPSLVDPARLDVGYGTGEQVVRNKLEGSWMQRQLQRCSLALPRHAPPNPAADLPEIITFELDVDGQGQVKRRKVTQASTRLDAEVRACIDQIFGWLRFPAPHPVAGRRGPAKVKGRLLISAER